jgi:hypothetical protein
MRVKYPEMAGPETKYGVDPAAEPRNVELKIEGARKPAQCGPEDLDLLFPCLAVIDFEVVGVCRS